MRIAQRRIRKPQNYLSGIASGANFYIVLNGLQSFTNQLQKIGFNPIIVIGEQILPSPIGSITRFNANGGHIIHRNQPKVTSTRIAQITDWHGFTHTTSISYQHYPRTPIPAPSVELLVMQGINNNPLLASPVLTNNAQSLDYIQHVINLFLETFGECEVYQDSLVPAFNVPVKKLNWNVLPRGKYPWSKLQSSILPIINTLSQQNKGVVLSRVQHLASHTPDFVAFGTGGFGGYIIFGFSRKNIYILESIHTGNATYVLGQNWQTISQFSKAQILNSNLHLHRIIHSSTWVNQINAIL